MKSPQLNKLKKSGYRITAARSAIIQLLENTFHPITASALHKMLARIGTAVNITTVYRELEFLHAEHIIEKVPLLDNELHYELTGRAHHHHVLCTTCGTIDDIHLNSEHGLLEEAHDASRFAIKRHSLTFYGECPHCQ